ncbi:putative malate dehydrogenase 1B [Danaus plexippus]|uniref:putative malate dehydrogenase 1B n=1 Tax=Danaus plexippus TaxID=13037 RepID=UPI002AAF313D|nr:putative malate dehydrogenase 1B [Danaus plexippus]
MNKNVVYNIKNTGIYIGLNKMVFRIVIAGESQCNIFAEVCLVADHISQNLPSFCYERIEKPVAEWKLWLCKINQKNKWHHIDSPIIWKELLMMGSKPFYIGGACEFLEYCHSYYNFDLFLSPTRFEHLVYNYGQYQRKIKQEKRLNSSSQIFDYQNDVKKSDYTICISGAGNPISMFIISGLFEMTSGDKIISKIYIYDDDCSQSLMDFIEYECNFLGGDLSSKVVKNIEKIGVALTGTNLLIILDYVPFRSTYSIGKWLYENKKVMERIALNINASASQKMYIVFPNLGPACYNATVLANAVKSLPRSNIVVVTSDIGLDIVPVAAEIADVPLKNIFCPPVWGFVGINHLADIHTTIHKYESFDPYNRFIKVRNSTLCVGTLTPELRSMEYLMFSDDTLWTKVAERKIQKKLSERPICINKAVAVLNLVKLWLFYPDPKNVVNLGIPCNGAFGLTFGGHFSQPANLVNGKWEPASNYALPRDPNMSISYLEEIAKLVMKLSKEDLPQLVPYTPCICKQPIRFTKYK